MRTASEHVARGQPGGSARLFFAVVPDSAARRALATLAREARRATGGRMAREENLHVTLAFLGNQPRERIGELEVIGTRAAAVTAPFLLTLDSVGAFREAGVAWAGTAAIPAGLQQLFDCLRSQLRAAGLPTERRAFHPHMTLARHCVREPAVVTMPPVAWRVESLELMTSETLPEGPRYRVLASWPLAGTEPRSP